MDSKPYKVATEQSLFDRLKLPRTCPVCQKAYSGWEAHVLEEHADSYLVHIACANCNSSLLSLVVLSSVGMSSVYGLTDLTVIDSIRLRDMAPITEDELLGFHELLASGQTFEKLHNHL